MISYCDPIIPEDVFISDTDIINFTHRKEKLLDDTFIIYNHKPELHKSIDNSDPSKYLDTIANIKTCASLCYTWKE